jgi:hypothetical protein
MVFSAVATTSMSSTTMNDATDASASAQPCARLRFCPGGRLRLLVVSTSPPVIDVSCRPLRHRDRRRLTGDG